MRRQPPSASILRIAGKMYSATSALDPPWVTIRYLPWQRFAGTEVHLTGQVGVMELRHVPHHARALGGGEDHALLGEFPDHLLDRGFVNPLDPPFLGG